MPNLSLERAGHCCQIIKKKYLVVSFGETTANKNADTIEIMNIYNKRKLKGWQSIQISSENLLDLVDMKSYIMFPDTKKIKD